MKRKLDLSLFGLTQLLAREDAKVGQEGRFSERLLLNRNDPEFQESHRVGRSVRSVPREFDCLPTGAEVSTRYGRAAAGTRVRRMPPTTNNAAILSTPMLESPVTWVNTPTISGPAIAANFPKML